MGWIISKALYEKWPCSQGRAVESLEDTCLDGKQSAPLNGSHTQPVYLSPDKMTAFSRLSRFGMMCKPLTESRGEDLLTWYRGDFLAKTYPRLEREKALPERVAVCGRTWHELSEKFDLDSCSWKIHHSLFPVELDWSSVILPRWGMIVSGQLYQHQTSERPISVTGSGLWATPTTMDKLPPKSEAALHREATVARPGRSKPANLRDQVSNMRNWPTPTAHNAKETNAPSEALRNEPTLASLVGGHLNPMWVEGLMGWPDDWSSLNNISHVKMCFWLMGHNHECDTRSREVLRVLRLGHAEKEIQSAIGGKVDICEAAILLSELCKHSDKPNEARVFMESAEALETELRSLRLCQQVASPPYRPRHLKQLLREYPDAMQALSRLLAHYGKTAWQDGSWENAIPRVGAGIAARVDRLKAIGNGQVSCVARAAFNILSK